MYMISLISGDQQDNLRRIQSLATVMLYSRHNINLIAQEHKISLLTQLEVPDFHQISSDHPSGKGVCTNLNSEVIVCQERLPTMRSSTEGRSYESRLVWAQIHILLSLDNVSNRDGICMWQVKLQIRIQCQV